MQPKVAKRLRAISPIPGIMYLLRFCRFAWGELVEKVVHYRRVAWLSKHPQNLKVIVDSLLAAAPTVSDTKFEYRSDIKVQISARKQAKVATGIYFTLFNEGSPAATVENGVGRVRRRSAPKGEEFLRTGIMIVIMGNHLAFLADGYTNDGQIAALLQKLLKQKNFPDKTAQFQLQPRANVKQLKRLLQNGVKSIDLGLLSFAATAAQLDQRGKNASWLKPLLRAGKQITNAIGRDRTEAEKQAASDVEVSIHLGYDGRHSDGETISKLLAEMALGVEQNASEFRIVTKDDAIITHEKLIVKSTVQVGGDDIASDPGSAFDALLATLKAWERMGVLDQ